MTEAQNNIVKFMQEELEYDLAYSTSNHLTFSIHLNHRLHYTELSDPKYCFSVSCEVEVNEDLKQTKFQFSYVPTKGCCALTSVEFSDITREDFINLERPFLHFAQSLWKTSQLL